MRHNEKNRHKNCPCKRALRICGELNIKEQLSHLNDFTSTWKHENVQSGVVYKRKLLFLISTLLFYGS